MGFTMRAAQTSQSTLVNAPVLSLALDLGVRDGILACIVGLGQKARLKPITARSTLSLMAQVRATKKRFGLPEDALVL